MHSTINHLINLDFDDRSEGSVELRAVSPSVRWTACLSVEYFINGPLKGHTDVANEDTPRQRGLLEVDNRNMIVVLLLEK
jgi:hypothetical protein